MKGLRLTLDEAKVVQLVDSSSHTLVSAPVPVDFRGHSNVFTGVWHLSVSHDLVVLRFAVVGNGQKAMTWCVSMSKLEKTGVYPLEYTEKFENATTLRIVLALSVIVMSMLLIRLGTTRPEVAVKHEDYNCSEIHISAGPPGARGPPPSSTPTIYIHTRIDNKNHLDATHKLCDEFRPHECVVILPDCSVNLEGTNLYYAFGVLEFRDSTCKLYVGKLGSILIEKPDRIYTASDTFDRPCGPLVLHNKKLILMCNGMLDRVWEPHAAVAAAAE
jgi:hypothetical protein